MVLADAVTVTGEVAVVSSSSFMICMMMVRNGVNEKSVKVGQASLLTYNNHLATLFVD